MPIRITGKCLMLFLLVIMGLILILRYFGFRSKRQYRFINLFILILILFSISLFFKELLAIPFRDFVFSASLWDFGF